MYYLYLIWASSLLASICFLLMRDGVNPKSDLKCSIAGFVFSLISLATVIYIYSLGN